MPIDSSIYGNIQAPDIVGSALKGFEQGAKISSFLGQKRKEQDLNDAYQKSMVQGPDGSVSLDRKMLLSSLASKGLSQEALAASEKFAQQDVLKREQQRKKIMSDAQDTIAVFSGANDQAGWDAALKRAVELGHGDAVAQLPPVFNPAVKNDLLAKAQKFALDYKDQVEQQNKQQELGFKAREVAVKEKEANLRNKELSANKEEALSTKYGTAKTVQDAKDIKSADEEKLNFDSKISELISLRKQFGGEVMNREAVARGKQLSKDLLLSYKNMAKLGVLSKSDEDIINAIIPPDPLAFRSPLEAAQNQDTVLNNLVKFKEDSDRDFQNKLSNRIRGYSAKEPQQAGAPKAGIVEQHSDGSKWKFKGGDPAQPSNWEKQ